MLSTFYCIITVGFNAVMSSADGIDWCALDCRKQGVKKNTMCTYKPQTEIGDCKNIRNSNTVDKRKQILHLHNQFRNAMAGGEKEKWPSAANMQQMTWDNTLESVALRWAQQCKAGHDDCRRTPEFQSVGQNYGMLASTAVSPENSVGSFEGWVNEISIADPSFVDAYQNGAWGHFTQVIWAGSYKLGCAEIQFTENEWHRTVLICNYGPAGNYMKNPIYEKGDACTKCPKDWRCIPGSPYPKLCAIPGSGDGVGNGRGNEGSASASACLDPFLILLTFSVAK